MYNNIALHKGRFKLIGNTDYNSSVNKFELYDIEKDPYEQKNIVSEYPEIGNELKSELDRVLKELVSSENMIDRPYIEAGSRYENPIILNRNDADGQWGIWDQEEIFGKWRVLINQGTYNLKFKFIKPIPPNGRMMVETKSFINQMKNKLDNTDIIEMKSVYLPEMKCDFAPFYEVGNRRIFPFWVEIEKIY
jgi:hypothetical protein